MSDRAIPNLPSRDFGATAQFYGGFGFVGGYRDEGWMILHRGTLALEFFPFPELEPHKSGFMCSVRVADLDGLYEQIRASGIPESGSGIPRLVPVVLQPWGQRGGYLIDLDGTQLNLIEDAG